MKLKKLAAVAMLAIGATTITAGAAYAQPAQVSVSSAPAHVSGVDHGIGFNTELSADRSRIVTTIDSGAFTVNGDSRTVAVSDRSGNVIARLPMSFELAGRQVNIRPTVDRVGTSLTLTQIGTTVPQARNIDADQRLNEQIQHAGFGAAIGAGIGLIVAFIFFPIALITVPVGAAIGFFAVGGQPLIDAIVAKFSGQP